MMSQSGPNEFPERTRAELQDEVKLVQRMHLDALRRIRTLEDELAAAKTAPAVQDQT